MVIEWLRFSVSPDSKEKFITKDQEIWTPFLGNYPGFLGKEIWLNPAIDEEIVVVIHWETEKQWKSIPQNALDRTEARFSQAVGADNYQMKESRKYQLRKFRNFC
jgi:uncharacterized protein (TIGR03792 family)